MSGITFSEIANNIKNPGVYMEIDDSLAVRGLPGKESVGMCWGQKLEIGTAEPNVVYEITEADQAIELTGDGSEIHRQAIIWFKNNQNNTFKFVVIKQTGGTKAKYKIDIKAESAKAGMVNILISGRNLQTTVLADSSAEDIASAVIEAINENKEIPLTALEFETKEGITTIPLEAKHAGAAGNFVSIKFNYYKGQSTPEGVTISSEKTTDGVGNSSLSEVIATLGDEYFTDLMTTYTDTANLLLIRDFLVERFGAMIANEAVLHFGFKGTMAEMVTLRESINSPYIMLYPAREVEEMPEEFAAAFAGNIAFEAQQDPARQYRTLVLKGMHPSGKHFSFKEKALMLNRGISTVTVDAGGNVYIDRVVTTYTTKPAGAKTEAYLDLMTVKTVVYFRFSYINRMAIKFPRHKLADDSYPVQPGQAIATPSVINAEAIALAKDWQAAGLIYNIDDFKKTLVTLMNANDKNRVDQGLQPIVMGNLMIIAALLQHK